MPGKTTTAMTTQIALSTRWNAYRHETGAGMLDEIRVLGFDRVELGYDLRVDLVPDVVAQVGRGSIAVASVHNFCPVPLGAPHGHPELFSLSSPDARERRLAVRHTEKTIRFAAEVGARQVVAHAGNVRMRRYTEKLIALAEAGKRDTPRYDRIRLKLLMQRDRKAAPYLAALEASITELLPVLESCAVKLGFENLPTWEAIPTEVELHALITRLATPWIGYWHDIGHGQIRQNLGLVNQLHWLQRLTPHLVGMHIHDVRAPAMDHIAPGLGDVNFREFAVAAANCPACVLEPAPGVPAEHLRNALDHLRRCWDDAAATDANAIPQEREIV
jgi:sugar phosphate isomerase/epimerase